MKRKAKHLGLELIGLVLSLIVLIPFYMLIINSGKTKEEAALVGLSLPTEWNFLKNYAEMFSAGRCVQKQRIAHSTKRFVGHSAVRSHRVCSAKATWARVFRAFYIYRAGPVYSRADYPNLLYLLLSASAFIFGCGIGSLCRQIGYYKSIPREIDESAMLDGCGCIRMFAAVIFPLLKPITVTLFIITFMAIWNDFGTTIYFLNSSSNFTLTLTVYNFFGVHSADWNLVFANVIAVSAPVVLVYFLAQKQIISGMTAGAVKG